ncbi:MAG TPA: hypothetical protein VKG26_10965, partial [Bacteroidia bacterium]|nr:hypothetical protein [Bacteroidia bacterium]
GRTGYRDNYEQKRGYGMNRNGRTIEGENGGNESYDEYDYSPRYDSGYGNNFNIGSYGSRNDNSDRRLNRGYETNYNRNSGLRSRGNYSSQQDHSNNRPYGRRMSDGSLSLRRTDGRGFAGSSNYDGRDEEYTSDRNHDNTYEGRRSSDGSFGSSLTEDGSARRRKYTY